MKRTFIDELANHVFTSIEQESPAHFLRTKEIIGNEYANNEMKLMIILLRKLKESNTVQDKRYQKKLEVIERELLSMADELEMKLR